MDLPEVDEDAVEEFPEGSIVFTQGEDAACMYLVLEGKVDLRVGGASVASAGKGDVFGEMALLDNSPRSATAAALEDTRLLPVDRQRFEHMVRLTPGFAREVLRTMATRLRRMNEAAREADPTPDSGSTMGLELGAVKVRQPTFKAGEVIFQAGEPGEHMFIVQYGTVEVRVGKTVVHTINTGGFFGEMALVDAAPRSASAYATKDCRLLPIDRTRFEVLLARTPDFALEVMRVMAGRLRRMNREGRKA